MATVKATKATQKWASTSRLARNTAHPLSAFRFGEELFGWQNLHAAPHRLVSGPAILMARHQTLTSPVEPGREGRDEARDQHHVGVGLVVDEFARNVQLAWVDRLHA